MNEREYIERQVHDEYYLRDTNCARTMLICLSELFQYPIPEPVMIASAGMHGAGGYRAQCGLVEGALLFIGLYSYHIGYSNAETVKASYDFAAFFEGRFSSLECKNLRPNGFNATDPPHLCEGLTANAIWETYNYLINYFSPQKTQQ